MLKICLVVHAVVYRSRGMPDFELIIVSVKSLSPDLCIALFYRPPSSKLFHYHLNG